MDDRNEPSPCARLRVVSGFELSIDGSIVRLPSHVERVLAYLAVNDREQPRQRVAFQLWTDLPEVRASANLRTALWRGRSATGRLIVARCGYLSLDPRLDVDVRHLRALAGRLVHPGSTVDDAEVDLSLMVGDLLPDWDEEWIETERERLRQLRVHALEAWCRRLTTEGRHAEAVDVGLLALSAEPLRETAQRLVIEAHLAEGNPSEAHRCFDLFRTRLWDELGLEPSSGLTELVGLGGGPRRAPVRVRRRNGPRRRPVSRSGSSRRSSR
jgi:DNA-binding SARP family transcriptional activator